MPAEQVAIETVVKTVTVLVVEALQTETVTVVPAVGAAATFTRAVVPRAPVLPVMELKYTHPEGVMLMPTH